MVHNCNQKSVIELKRARELYCQLQKWRKIRGRPEKKINFNISGYKAQGDKIANTERERRENKGKKREGRMKEK